MQLTSLIGTKAYQKQGFLENGKRVPLSAVIVAGNIITQIKTTEKEKYGALQLGIGSDKKANTILQGHSKKAGLKITPRFLKEIRVEDLEGAVLGSEINIADVFAPGDMVDVIGTSKGKGWAGVVKRHNFRGGPRTHGQSDRERAPGSIGQTTTPGRVYKGKRMAGRMGSETVTVKNLEIIDVTTDGVLLIKGLVPGSLNELLVVTKVGVNKKFTPLYNDKKDEPVQAQDGDSSSSIPDDAQQVESSDSDQTHPSDDAQFVHAETQSSDSSSLSGNQSETSKIETEASEGSVSGSPQDGSVSAANDNKEKKEEVSSDAKAMDDKK